jgi:signal transduction histidine kinase
MRDRLDPRSWPVTVTVPLIVVLLMVAIGGALSQQVLQRLETSQRNSLSALTNAYLDGLSAALLPSVLRRDTWEVFDALDRARDRYVHVNARATVVVDTGGKVLAAGDPHRFPTDSELPAQWLAAFPVEGITFDESRALAFALRPLQDQGRLIGAIYAELDIAPLLAERREVLWTLILTNGGLTLLLALMGYLLVRRVMRPVATLAEHLLRARAGPLRPISAAKFGHPRSAFSQLFLRYNALLQQVNEREQLLAQLAEEERLAALGRLASGLAHEINNPLGGMQTALDTLQKHGERPDVRKEGIALLMRGLHGIRDVVRSTLAVYKSDEGRRDLQPADLDDLRYLIQHEVSRRRLALDWRNRLSDRHAIDGGVLRQALLNLLLNACAASPPGSTVGFEAIEEPAGLRLAVSDQGSGLPAAQVRMLQGRDALPKLPARDSGLGLWMVARLVGGLRGRIDIERLSPGTRIVIVLPGARREVAAVAAA